MKVIIWIGAENMQTVEILYKIDEYLELMTPEPDYIPGYEERNEIRNKLTDCFDGISVHGLPVLNIESGQEIDYPILDERFKGGLAAIANVILEKAPVPRTVTVGGMTLELNSTTAEVIIETVIEEANEGKIDLTVKTESQGGQGSVVRPLEIKTGKPSYSHSHQGQVMLYCLMSGDRREQARAGLLLYLRYLISEGNNSPGIEESGFWRLLEVTMPTPHI